MEYKYLAIKNWDKFQHYRDRNPPWIKLHRELLTSTTWASADDASRVLAVAFMMLAAITGNRIPADKAYIKRVAYLNSEPDWSYLLSVQFIEEIEDKKNRKRVASKVEQPKKNARPEGETEGETENKKLSSHSRSAEKVFDKAYEQYPRHVGKRLAEKAWDSALGRGNEPDFLYQRVMQYAACCQRAHKEKQYTPHMATWLNQDRFMDDPSEWAVTENGKHQGDYVVRPAAAKSLTDPDCKVCKGTGWDRVDNRAFECQCRKRNKANATNGTAVGLGAERASAAVAGAGGQTEAAGNDR